MPVPQLFVQPGTATSVVATGTDESARDGIEGRSVEERPVACQAPKGLTAREGSLISTARRTTVPGSMPSTIATAAPVPAPIISFAIFAAYKRS